MPELNDTKEMWLSGQCDIADEDDKRCSEMATIEVYDTKGKFYLDLCKEHHRKLYANTNAITKPLDTNQN